MSTWPPEDQPLVGLAARSDAPAEGRRYLAPFGAGRTQPSQASDVIGGPQSQAAGGGAQDAASTGPGFPSLAGGLTHAGPGRLDLGAAAVAGDPHHRLSLDHGEAEEIVLASGECQRPGGEAPIALRRAAIGIRGDACDAADPFLPRKGLQVRAAAGRGQGRRCGPAPRRERAISSPISGHGLRCWAWAPLLSVLAPHRWGATLTAQSACERAR